MFLPNFLVSNRRFETEDTARGHHSTMSASLWTVETSRKTWRALTDGRDDGDGVEQRARERPLQVRLVGGVAPVPALRRDGVTASRTAPHTHRRLVHSYLQVTIASAESDERERCKSSMRNGTATLDRVRWRFGRCGCC